jgi:hypothetical protein
MKITSLLLVAAVLLNGASASAKKPPRETVTVIDQITGTTAYDWQMDGRVSVSCYGNTCSGYFRDPQYGTQHILGAVLKLQRSDSSIVIAVCESKVNIFATITLAVDALNAGDPNSPTSYRDCRMPAPGTIVDADFRDKTVKLYWQGTYETYSIRGILQPSSTQRPPPQNVDAVIPPKAMVQAVSIPVTPKTYSYPEDGFSITFPADPKLDTGATRFKLRDYISPDFSMALYAGVSLPRSFILLSPLEATLETAKNAAVSGSNMELIREQKIALGIYPGLEIELENDATHTLMRIFLIGDTLYQISASTPNGKSYEQASRFLDSFQLIPRVR